ncbi:MAG: ABC transporter ATP-binding protein, partial [Armatimonadetes bacterium]|nr:ABC transporter ATP-binding protein [Armatimonadota bacterium]
MTPPPRMTLSFKEMFGVAKRFAPYAKHYWFYFVAGIIATFILNAAGIVQPYILKVLTDRVLATPGGNLSVLNFACLALVGTSLIKGAFLYVQAYMMAYGNNATIKAIREDVYRHLQMLPMAWFDRARTGDVILRLTDDIRVVTELLAAGIIMLLNDVIVSVGALTYMLTKNFW